MNHNGKSKMSVAVTSIAMLGCVIAAMTLATSTPVFAQAPDVNAEKPISLNFQNAPIQSVLKALFNSVGANYSIDSDVQGSVNITMSNVGFLAALRSLLHANNPPLTYDFTDGVYHIRVRKTDNTNNQGGSSPLNLNTTTSTPDSGTTTVSADNKRYYKLPVDHYAVDMLLPYLVNNVGIFVVPAGMSGTNGGSMGPSTTQSGGGGMGMSGGMGGMSGGMGGGMGGFSR